MDLFRRLCCLLLTVVYSIDADYILTEQEYTWSQANEVCTLATPNLTFNASGVTPDVDIPLDTDVWLGYVENMTPFEYFGCTRIHYLNLVTADHITEGDPGKCWSACKNVTAIAVYENKCYCIETVNIDKGIRMYDRCDIGCPSQPNIVCGGYYGYVSLYKTTFTGPIRTSNSDTSLCLWYDITIHTFSWGQCTELYRVVCYRDQMVWLYDYSDTYGDWITMTNRCFSDGGIPSNYNNTMRVNTSITSQTWTGVIRNGVIYPVTDSPNVMTGKYGYTSVETGKLLFTNNVTVTKRALCVEGTIVADSTITTGDRYESTSGTTNQRSITGENTADEKQSLKEESANVGVIVGVTLSIIIVIIVAVVIIVLWKRGVKLPFVQKRKPNKQHGQAAIHTTRAAGRDNAIQGASEADGYEEVDVTNISPGNNIIPNTDDSRARINNDEAHTYRNLDNDVIDVAHTYSNVENNAPGEDHTYQNQEIKTIDEAHTYLGLQNITPDDHTYSGLAVGKSLPKQQF
ncbi:hypothetical protein ACF0H5_012103 [Mactra antiquata]